MAAQDEDPGKAALQSWYKQPKASEEPGNINNPIFQVHFTHIPTAKKVSFKGWVTGFSDNFQSQWTGTPVYGRMDDLYTFQKTSRRISLAFDVIAADGDEARTNLVNLNKLTQFLYPVYSDPVAKNPGTPSRNSQVLQAAPLLKMSWNGLVRDAATGAELVGFLAGFIYQPVIDNGPFFTTGGNLAYQHHTVQLEFTVLHTHLTGWTKDGNVLTFGGSNKTQKDYPHAVESSGGDRPSSPPGSLGSVSDAALLHDTVANAAAGAATGQGGSVEPAGNPPPDLQAWINAGSPGGPTGFTAWQQNRLNEAASPVTAAGEEDITTP
jgi:hypothetical protein